MTSKIQPDRSLSEMQCQIWQFKQTQLGEVNAYLTPVNNHFQIRLESQRVECLLELSIESESSNSAHVIASQLDINNALTRLALLQLLDLVFATQVQLDTINVNDELQVCLPSAILLEKTLNRSAFYQWPELWQPMLLEYPRAQQLVKSGDINHPIRPPYPVGEFYRRYIPTLNKTLSFRIIDPEVDLDVFHRWMNMPGIAPIWELGKPKDELYQYLTERQKDPHIYSTIGCYDDEPFGYFELYWVQEDRLGAYYDSRPFDRGFHLLVGNRRYLGEDFFKAWILGLNHNLFLDDPRTQRVMGEPRADNKKLLRYVEKIHCYRKLKEFDFPHKRAALMECDRNRLFHEEIFP